MSYIAIVDYDAGWPRAKSAGGRFCAGQRSFAGLANGRKSTNPEQGSIVRGQKRRSERHKP